MNILPKYCGGEIFDVRHVIVNSEIFFSAKDVAEMLEYANTTNACKNNVRPKNKRPSHELIDTTQLPPNERNSTYISKSGLNQWIAQSDKPKAQPFQDWLYEECLPKLRKIMLQQQIGIENENKLHYKVISFVTKILSRCLARRWIGWITRYIRKTYRCMAQRVYGRSSRCYNLQSPRTIFWFLHRTQVSKWLWSSINKSKRCFGVICKMQLQDHAEQQLRRYSCFNHWLHVEHLGMLRGLPKEIQINHVLNIASQSIPQNSKLANIEGAIKKVSREVATRSVRLL